MKKFEDAKLPELKKRVEEVKLKLDVARRVYEVFEEDGYYGPYSLGTDLWKEFKAAFEKDKKE